MKLLRISLAVFLLIQIAVAQDGLLMNTLRYIERDEPATIDPVTVHDVVSLRITEILYGGLYSKDKWLTRIPEFADGAPQLTNNGMSAIVKLKPGLKFSDGSPIMPSDIIFTFQASTHPGSDNENRQAFSNIVNISAIDSSTIQVDFKTPVKEPEKYLQFFIIPKREFFGPQITRDLTYCREPGKTSGGYTLKEMAHSLKKYIFRRNENYSGKNPAQIEQVELNVYPDYNAHFDQLRLGQVDLVPFVLPTDLPRVRRDSRFNLVSYDANQYDFIAFNFNNELLQLLPLRQAINMGFNRPEILKAYFDDNGELMSGPFPTTHSGYNPSVLPWEFNYNLAITMLENAGFVDTDGDSIREFEGKPLQFDLLTGIGEDQIYNKVINSFIQQMALLGIKINMRSYMADIFEDKVRRGDFDMVYYTRKITPEADYSPFFISSEAYAGGKNIGYYHNTTVDTLFIQSKLTQDFEIRTNIYKEIHKILKEDCPYVYLWYLKHYAAYTRRLQNVNIDQYYFFTTIEDWFFKEE